MRPLAIVLLLLTLLVPCRADDTVTRPTGTPVRLFTLPDGVRLLLKPEQSTEITAITLFVRMPRDLDAEQTAQGEMVAHALFYGTTDHTRAGIALSVAQVGGVLETLRTPDYVALTVVTVPDQIEETARMLGEALKHADFAPDALELAYRDILAERQRRRENGDEAGVARLRALLGGMPEPSEDLLRHVTQEQATRYFQARYVPGRTVVAIVGRFAVPTVETAFRAFFADYDRPTPPAGIAPPNADASAPPPASPARITREQMIPERITGASAGVAYALVGARAPTVDSKDSPAYAVLQTLLGGGHASRLFRRLRDTLGVGYNVGATYRTDLSDPLIALLQWDPQRADVSGAGTALTPADALQRLEMQLDGVLSDPPDEAEVERARNVAIGRDALRHERARDRAFLLGWYEAMGLGYGYDADYPRLLAAVTRADLLRIAAHYLPQRAAVVIAPASH